MEAHRGLFAERNDAVEVEIVDRYLNVVTRDGRRISAPLNWWPWLRDATDEQRREINNYGASFYFPALGKGISMEVILLGRAPERNFTLRPA